MTATALDTRRELAHRTGHDLEVTLLWSKPANRVTIEVLDKSLGESLEFEVAGRDALDAFHHLYEYLTSRQTKIRAKTQIAFSEALAPTQ